MDIDLSDITFDDNIGDETENREFKVGRIDNSTFHRLACKHIEDKTLNEKKINITFAEELIKTNRFPLNSAIITTLKKYGKKYISEHFCAFNNKKIEGELLFGVNDWGFVKGFPYQGNIPTEQITKKYYNYLHNMIKPKMERDFFEKYVKIEFVKIKYNIINNIINNTTIKDPISPKYLKYLEEKRMFENQLMKEKAIFNDWKIRYAFVTRAMATLLNSYESRILIIDYIKSIDPTSDVIKLLESGENIVSLSKEDISKVVRDITNPYYWVSEWKDYMCCKLVEERPTFSHTDFVDMNIPVNIVCNMSEMIPYWITNDNMNLYMVVIKFIPMDKDIKWSYYDHNTQEYVSCYRTSTPNNGPSNMLF